MQFNDFTWDFIITSKGYIFWGSNKKKTYNIEQLNETIIRVYNLIRPL